MKKSSSFLSASLKSYYKGTGRDFHEDLAHHAMDDFPLIHFTPTELLLARPVSLNAAPHHIINPAHHFLPARANAWHIHLMIGSAPDLARALASYQKHYPFLCFQRRGRPFEGLRHYKTRDFISKLALYA